MNHDVYIPCHHAHWRGYVHREYADLFNNVDPLAALQQLPHTVARDRPGVRLLRIDTPRGDMYAKHLTAASVATDESPNLQSRLRWALGASRAVRVLRTCALLKRAGFEAPRTVLAVRRRRGLHVEELLVNLAVPGPTLKEALAAAPDRAAAVALLKLMARETHRLHAAGFMHGDLLPANMILTGPDRICLIDNDRTRRAPLAARYAWRRNVMQMTLRLLRNNGNRAAMIFLHAYMSLRPGDTAHTRRALAAMLRETRRRNARHSRDKTPKRRIPRQSGATLPR